MNGKLTASRSTLLLVAGALAASLSFADDAATTPAASTQVTGKLGAEYGSFIGPDSEYVVSGLRDGTAITLPATDPANTSGVVVIEPPTGPMGYGNVDHSLALAQAQLQQYGIYQPTAEQLQAALTGGDIYLVDTSGNVTAVPLDGVLTLRAEGMGWGEIAHQYGMKLGPVVSGKAVVTPYAAEPVPAPDGTATAVAPKGRGIVTASGGSATPGKAGSGGKASGKGIVSAGGTELGGSSAGAKGQANGRGIVTAGGNAYGHSGGGKGIVTAGGGSAGAGGNAYGQAGGAGRGVVTAGGTSSTVVGSNGGKGLALGHAK